MNIILRWARWGNALISDNTLLGDTGELLLKDKRRESMKGTCVLPYLLAPVGRIESEEPGVREEGLFSCWGENRCKRHLLVGRQLKSYGNVGAFCWQEIAPKLCSIGGGPPGKEKKKGRDDKRHKGGSKEEVHPGTDR